MKNRPMPHSLTIGLLLFGLLLSIFGVAEIFLRVYYAPTPEKILYSSSYEKAKGIPKGPDYNFLLNSKGYKDTEFTEKKQGRFRIVALGDSFTFGNVPYLDSYIFLLEKKLTTITPELEITNLGLPGIGLSAQLAILSREGLALNPDMLLLSIFIGDDILQSKARKYYSFSYLLSWFNTYMKDKRHYPGKTYHPDTDYCDTCKALPPNELITLEKERLFLYRPSDKQFLRNLKHTKYYLHKILDICERHNIIPAVVLIPTVLQTNSLLQNDVLSLSQKAEPSATEWLWSQPNDLLKSYLQERNIQCIDLLPYFIERTNAKLYRKEDIHWNLAGHAFAAETVSTALQMHQP